MPNSTAKSPLTISGSSQLQVSGTPTESEIQWPSQMRKQGLSNVDTVFETWKKDPSPDNGAALMNHIQPHIESAVRRHTGEATPVNLGRARSMLTKSIGNYDGRASMATYIDRQLLPMKRWAAKHRSGVKLPTSYAQERAHLSRSEANFEEDHGRLPSRAELADISGINLDRMEKVLSTNLPVASEREYGNSADGPMQAGDQGIEDDGKAWVKMVYYSLNPTNQFILEHSMGLYGAKELSNREIARKLKITPGAVSQRKAQIQNRLNEQ